MKHLLRYVALLAVMVIAYYVFASNPEPSTTQLPVISTVEEGAKLLPADKEIEITNVKDGQYISSPLVINGIARGWYFEGSFPISLLSPDGTVMATGIATAKSDWMTAEPVEFTSTLEWVENKNIKDGILLFKKDNPSGDPERDRSFSLKVKLQN